MTSSDFKQHALNLAQALEPQDALQASAILQALRERGAEEFARSDWPGRKTEQWKYTSLLSMQDYASAGWAAPKAALPPTAALADIEQTDATKLFFVDGAFNVEASDALPAGVTFFSQADESASAVLKNYLGSIAAGVDASRRNLFTSLNNAWLSEGVLVHVARDAALDKPLYFVHLSSASLASQTVANQRLLVVLEQGASAQIIEHFLSADDASSGFVNGLTEIQVGQNARLHHTRLHLEHEASSHIGAVHINLQRDSVVDAFTLAEGSKLKRIDYQMNHCGPGAHLTLNGVYLARHQQLVDYHTTIEHRVPHCTSQEVFRGIVGDKAKAVFNGRIHIHKDAQKTLAELNNRNLLTSNSAEVDTKPELEIYADDVRCAHGATISQLDETSMYYLQSRGIDTAQARMMLSYGFINEVMSALPHKIVLELLQTHLRARFIEESSVE